MMSASKNHLLVLLKMLLLIFGMDFPAASAQFRPPIYIPPQQPIVLTQQPRQQNNVNNVNNRNNVINFGTSQQQLGGQQQIFRGGQQGQQFGTAQQQQQQQYGLPPAPTVRTSLGSIRGKVVRTKGGFLMDTYLSVPYGERVKRFQAPQAKQAWNGIVDASIEREGCTQEQYTGLPRRWTFSSKPRKRNNSGENCLYLKVLIPTNLRGMNQLLPVLFWSHGGGFGAGSGTAYDIDAQGDNIVIIVQPNYRVGPFGFFTTGSEEAPGNYALQDVLLALQMIKREIQSFGGDPNRITIMGQGAGAIMTSLLTLSPSAAGLFQKAIMLSGTAFMPKINTRAEENTLRNQNFATAAGCDDRSNSRWRSRDFRGIVECLQGRTEEELLQAQYEAKMEYSLAWHPVVDPNSQVLPLPFDQLAKSRPNIPVIMGDTKDESAFDIFVLPALDGAFDSNATNFRLQMPREWTMINSQEKARQECDSSITSAYYSNPNPMRALCKVQYADPKYLAVTSDPSFWYKQAVSVGSNFNYHAPIKRDLDYQMANGNRQTYLYSFDYVRTQGQPADFWQAAGAFHNFDIMFLENFSIDDSLRFPFDARDNQVRDLMTQAFTNFAKTDNPSTPQIKWDPLNGFNYLSINSPPQMRDYFHLEDIYFWNRFAPIIASLNGRQ